ncbi:MAG: class I SAM-dependent methyltransferase [Verrucomicrobiota bacterium]
MGTQNGNGESNGSQGNGGGSKDSMVVGRSSQGVEIHATLLRLTRFLVAFEIYNPSLVLRSSEVLTDFKIIVNDRTVYSGRAVVSGLVNMGGVLVCEASLGDSWLGLEAFLPSRPGDQSKAFQAFLRHWQEVYRIRPEFKVVVADMYTFLSELRLWLEQLELGIRSAPAGDRLRMEHEIGSELGKSTTPALTNLFERFEEALATVDREQVEAHQSYCRRQLHPMLLCSPFLYRTFTKPLGYAGDYEMVNMMLRDPLEGGSLYAKIVNHWFLHQPPAEAHRNRINYLVGHLVSQAARSLRGGAPARVLSVGCGPAQEIQRFLAESDLSESTRFTLIDFNEETITHCQSVLEGAKRQAHRGTPIKYVRKSVHQILKESARSVDAGGGDRYDLVYCAGLFDYLSDTVCRKLTSICYDWLAPGGLLITTNVDAGNPRRLTMDYIMEWHLNYRNSPEVGALKPASLAPDLCAVKSDGTGVNIFCEMNKPSRVEAPAI